MHDFNNQVYFFEPGDYNFVSDILWNKATPICENNGLGLFVWKDAFKLKLETYVGGRILFSVADNTYFFPFCDSKENAFSLLNEILSQKKELNLSKITREELDFVKNSFKNCEYSLEEGDCDYIYNINALADLPGSKLSKKRNHINGFLKTYDKWNVEEISRENLDEIIEFADFWYEKKEKSEEGEISENSIFNLEIEKAALMKILNNLDEIGCDNLVLRVGEKVAGFTIGQRINPEYFDVVYEKGSEDMRGTYNILNREFARYLRLKYKDLKYINRENDLNLPGLRQAKMSYMPAFLLEKYNCKIKL